MPLQKETIKNARFLKLTFAGLSPNTLMAFQIPYPREDLTKELIEAAMNVFIDANIFYKKGLELHSKVSAEIIERTVHTTDFDISVQ